MNHYAHAYPPNLDHWRELIRYVLPAIKHVIFEPALGVSTNQQSLIYQGDVGTTMSVGDQRERKRKNRVTDNRKPRTPRGWATIKWRAE